MISRDRQLCVALLLLTGPMPVWSCVDQCSVTENCISVERSTDDLGCSDDYAFLDPYNDSRTNLALLYSALTGAAASSTTDNSDESRRYSDAYARFKPSEPASNGNPQDCRGNDYVAAIPFLQALASAKIDQPQARQLAQLRNRMLCTTVDSSLDVDLARFKADVRAISGSEEANDFAMYLQAAADFYARRFDDTLTETEPLLQSHNEWIRQTSLVLRARAYMVRSQVSWDGYTQDLEQINTKDLTKSVEAYAEYLRRYPRGYYGKSAQGQLRRAQYLAGDDDAYQESFLEAWHGAEREKLPYTDFKALIQEADQFIPYRDIAVTDQGLDGGIDDDPLLLAAGILVYYRGGSGGDKDPSRLVRKEIEDQGDNLDVVPGLKTYLLMVDAAAHNEWERVYQAAAVHEKTEPAIITAAKKMLAANAAEKTKRWDEALSTWADLATGQEPARQRAQAGYLRTAVEAGRPEALLASNTFLGMAPAYAIRHYFTVDQLRAALGNKQTTPSLRTVAAQTLLLRDALAQRWELFLLDYEHTPAEDRAIVSALETAARTLAKRPKDPKALLNAGYFFVDRFALVDDLRLCLLEASLDGELKPLLSAEYQAWGYDRPITYFTRALDQHPSRDLEAKLLYHAIKCFSPAWGNACGRGDVSPGTRQQWFTTLKTKYAGTEWARKTKYWW